MAAGYDGNIRIDTSIDSKGFNAGIQKMMGSLKGLAAAMGVAFGIGAVVMFGKSAVSAAAEAEAAYIGLRSVVEGTGHSFTQAKSFIDSYVSDGLVPATDAVAAYKNLLMRGYDTSQIEKMMNALKDSAAFGRQGSLTMGQAIRGATEGLKNENSVLVDNAGVTKNVSIMWKDYAAKIGTTVGMLTTAQKRQAEYEGILNETRFQQGDAAKMADSYAGRLAALGTSFYNLRVAIGNSIIPIISKILPYIKAAVDALTIFFNKVALVVQILFGTDVSAVMNETQEAMSDMAGGASEAAGGQEKLGKKIKDTAKAAKGALAAFDQLNVLQQENADQAEADTGGGGAGVPTGGGAPQLPASDDKSGGMAGDLEALKAQIEQFKEDALKFFAPVTEAFDRMKEKLEPLTQTLWDGLKWAWDNILVPLGAWVVTDVVPVFLDDIGIAGDTLNDILIALQPMGLWLWDEFLKPAAEWTGGVIVSALESLGDALEGIGDWVSDNQESFATMTATVVGFLAAWKIGTMISDLAGWTVELYKNVAAWIASTAAKIANTAATIAMNVAVGAWNVIAVIASAVTWAFGAAVAFLTSPIFLVVLAIVALIAIVYLLIKYWPQIKEYAIAAWNAIVAMWKAAGTWFKTNVVDPIKNGFYIMLDNLKKKWTDIFTGIKDFIKNTVNGIIGFINGMIRAVAGGLNNVINAMNKIKVTIPSWAPAPYGGQTFGLNLPTVAAPQIPYLAKGAVIPPNAQFAAVLGDQRNGRNLEAPEGLIREIIREEIGTVKSDVTINFAGSLGPLVRELMPYIEKERVRIGSSLVRGTT